MSNWKQAVKVNVTAAPAPAVAPLGPTAQALYDAADRFTAQGKEDKASTCRDIANKVYKWGFASDKQRDFAAKLVEWSQPKADAPVNPAIAQDLAALHAAAPRWEARGDVAKADICRDMATKLARFGSFASPRQEEFARVLMNVPAPVALPGTPSAIAPDASVDQKYNLLANNVSMPKTFDVMQKHSTLHIGDLKVSRKNQDSWCWIIWQDKVAGKLVNGNAVLWFSKVASEKTAFVALLNEIEADPLAAAMKYGKLSGRCCSCGRDLTDPESIERGIGPICAEKFA